MAHYLFAGCEWALCQAPLGCCRGHMVSQISMLEIKDCITVGAKGKGRGHNRWDNAHQLFCLTLKRLRGKKCLVKNFNHFLFLILMLSRENADSPVKQASRTLIIKECPCFFFILDSTCSLEVCSFNHLFPEPKVVMLENHNNLQINYHAIW